MMEPARERLLEAAERRARTAGYHGFSFRDVAADVGVKSASVHYHFPTKSDLGAALVGRYLSRAKLRLGDPNGLSPAEAVARVVALFQDALLVDDRMCLCGLFGAERDALPPAVAEATAEFFKWLLTFLEAAKVERPGMPTPAQIIAQLEGGLILARTLGDAQILTGIADALTAA